MYVRYYTYQHQGSVTVVEDVLFNSIKGKFFQSYTFSGSFLGRHFSMIYITIMAIYYLFPSILTIFVLKSFFLSIGAIFIYRITKNKLKYKQAKNILSITYLISPLIWILNFDDFFAIIIAIPLILAIIFYLEEKKWTYYFVFIILLLLVQEETSFIIIMLGIYVFLKSNKKVGIITFLSGLVGLLLITNVFIPYFSEGEYYIYSIRYSYIGEDFFDALKTIITNPEQVLNNSQVINKVDYVLFFLLTFLFIPLFSYFSLITLPMFFLNLFSTNTDVLCVLFHYTALITPIFFISTIYGLKKIGKKYKQTTVKKIVISFFIFTLLLSFVFLFSLIINPNKFQEISVINKYCPVSYLPNFNYVFIKEKIKNYDELHKFTKNLPEKTTILTTLKTFPYTKDMNTRILFPRAEKYSTEYIILDKEENQEDYDGFPLSNLSEKIIKQNYTLILKNKNYLIYKKIE